MTAHQMLCHLSDSFLLVMGEKNAGSKSGWFQRSIMKWMALRSPLPWPHGISTLPEMDQQIGGTPPVEFTRDLNRLLALTDRFVAQPRDFRFAAHPIFGEMTEEEWMRWAYLHMSHHLRQFGIE